MTTTCRPLRGLDWLYRNESLGSAALHPRLYAVACSAGWSPDMPSPAP